MRGEELKVLILGGYGTFGGRLVELLRDEQRLTLVIVGRSRAKAEAFCARLSGKAKTLAASFDREGDVVAVLRLVAPDLIVDASGPFQAYGADPYRVVRAALDLGIDYLDFADGSEFVAGIAQFDEEARSRGIFVLAGASSFPVLTAAAARSLSHDVADIDAIVGGIAPSPYAGVGLNVIRAIASYAGKPVALIRDGVRTFGHGLIDARRYTIAPPGRLPLRNIRFSLVDVPDLKVLADLWPNVRHVWMGAGPVPEILHRALSAIAWLVRLKIVRSLSPLAPLMYRAVNALRWGEHRGGMFVSVAGAASDGTRIERSWHLLAERDDGPLIPSMTAEAIVRHCLDGRRPASGARPAATDLELADYDALFACRTIFTGRREEGAAIDSLPLYRRLLGDAWLLLPASVRAIHDVKWTLAAQGRATVERGSGPIARLVAALFRFPQAGRDVPVEVHFRSRERGEVWRRTFAGRSFSSRQERGLGRYDRLLCERFGPFGFGLALVVVDGQLRLIVRHWDFLGVPLPLALAPRGESYETEEDGRFHFHVEISLPFAGLVARYRGWLVPRA